METPPSACAFSISQNLLLAFLLSPIANGLRNSECKPQNPHASSGFGAQTFTD